VRGVPYGRPEVDGRRRVGAVGVEFFCLLLMTTAIQGKGRELLGEVEKLEGAE